MGLLKQHSHHWGTTLGSLLYHWLFISDSVDSVNRPASPGCVISCPRPKSESFRTGKKPPLSNQFAGLMSCEKKVIPERNPDHQWLLFFPKIPMRIGGHGRKHS